MTLPHVAYGDPHVAAHNAERDAINDIVTDISMLPIPSTEDIQAIGDVRYGSLDRSIFPAHVEPGRRLIRHPRPPKVEITNSSTIPSAVFSGVTSGGVVLTPDQIPFDFGLRDNQMDTMRNIFTGIGYANSYPYNAAVLPSIAKGAPYCSYYNSGFYSVRWTTDAPQLEIIAIIGVSQADWQIYVDGQPIFSVPVAGNPGSGNSVIRLTHASRKMRTYELMGGLYFIGINVSPSDRVTKPGALTGPKVAWFGDSVVQGTGATVSQMGFAYSANRMVGWDRFELHAAGGTGFATAGSFLTFINRVPYLNTDIDVLICDGGYNDGGVSDPDVWAGLVVAFYQAVRVRLPKAKLIHIGPWGHIRTGAAPLYLARMNSLITAFNSNPGLVDVLIDTVHQGYWFTGTGYVGAPVGDGNSDFYIYSDGVHFSQAGHDYVAKRIADILGGFFKEYFPNDPTVLDNRRTIVDTAANLAITNQPAEIGQLVFETDTKFLRGPGDGTALPSALPVLTPLEKWNSRVTPNGPQFAVSGGVPVPFLYYGAGMIGVFVNGGNGCSVTYKGDIGPGTWTARIWYCKLSNLGIMNVDYSIDNGTTWVSAVASLDLYNATAVYTLTVDKTGIVIPNGVSTILFRWTSIGKNASASQYYPIAGEVVLTRTA